MNINSSNDTFPHIWALLAPQDEFRSRELACRRMWETFDTDKQRSIYARIRGKMQRGENVSQNPYFAIQDNIDPSPPKLQPPKNYNGSNDFLQVVKTGTLVTAEFNGEVGIYTEADAAKHQMTIIKHLQPCN